jgi:hypothetical protein
MANTEPSHALSVQRQNPLGHISAFSMTLGVGISSKDSLIGERVAAGVSIDGKSSRDQIERCYGEDAGKRNPLTLLVGM